MIDALTQYLTVVLTDADPLNDWLTHLPTFLQTFALTLGQCIAHLRS